MEPPGGHECAARRLIFHAQFSGFCWEPPGGDELPPSDISGMAWAVGQSVVGCIKTSKSFATSIASGDRTSTKVLAPRGTWRQGVFCQAINPATVGLSELGAWRRGRCAKRFVQVLPSGT
ncbi:hypothetical protein DEO72_LG1g2627 [Vigna unguiculata]|uniref:Uncharacterized protein n=1 Tax=Vigna unguiculata TaxID=3917 RepID=A0A4D6KQP4_VIGUN|nr:hypothetical protein DEO72_LG1g2627 [Vigna unguiculata]